MLNHCQAVKYARNLSLTNDLSCHNRHRIDFDKHFYFEWALLCGGLKDRMKEQTYIVQVKWKASDKKLHADRMTKVPN